MPHQGRKPASLDDVLRSVEDLAERLETVAPRPPAGAADKPRSWLKAAINDGQIHLTVECSTQINEFIANRWRLLTEAEGLEKMEDRSYLLNSFDPIEELDQYLSPFWAHYDDLHYAQVLFQAAVSEWIDRKPWRAYVDEYRDVPRRVSSKDQFLADIETWARREEPQDLARLRKAGEAALRLDVRAMRKVLAPMLARDGDQVEQVSRELHARLDVDDDRSASHSALDQAPVQQREPDDQRTRREREKAIAAAVAELKAKNRERARSASAQMKDATRKPGKS